MSAKAFCREQDIIFFNAKFTNLANDAKKNLENFVFFALFAFFVLKKSKVSVKICVQIKNTTIEAIDTNIRRHRKIKADANPYDPIWETYFEERLALRMGKELLGNRKAWQLWKNQNGHCPECDELITSETGWHIHHVVYRVYGGKDILSNLHLLHPNCHRKLHQEKPSPTLPGSHSASL